jgi:methyl-accepting chemotaxis protein
VLGSRVGESTRAPTRALWVVAGFELGSTVAVALLWLVLLGFSDVRVAAPLAVLRVVAELGYMHVLLGPVREYTKQRAAGREPENGVLLEADNSLQRLLGRLSVVNSLGWVVALLLSLLPAVGVPFDHPLPAAELLTAVLLIISVAIGSPMLLSDPIQSALLPARVELSRALVDRGLTHHREPSSIATHLAVRNFSSVAVLLVACCAVAALLRIRGIRDEAVSEQMRRAELSVARLGQESPEEGVALVALDELPGPLGVDPDAAKGEVFAIYDPVTERAIAAVAIGDGRWALAQVEPDEQLGITAAFIVLLCVVALTPSVLSAISLGRAVTEPIEELDAAAREVIETGELGRITRIAPLRNDEVGKLAVTFNLMLDAFHELALAAREVADGNLRATLERPGDLPDAFRAMLGQLHAMVLRIRETTLELASAATELLAATDTQGATAERQAASVEQVTQTTTSLAASALQITATAMAVRENAEQSMKTATVAVSRIDELERQAHGIRELLELINEIADRSDLLALNGSLEAVRAGDAGRGFGLVAAEMRRLAERVAGAVGDIRERVSSIESTAMNTIAATQQNRELAENTVTAAREINEAITEQSAKTEDAASLAERVLAAVSAFEDATVQTRSTAESLRAQAEQLEQLTAQFRL